MMIKMIKMIKMVTFEMAKQWWQRACVPASSDRRDQCPDVPDHHHHHHNDNDYIDDDNNDLNDCVFFICCIPETSIPGKAVWAENLKSVLGGHTLPIPLHFDQIGHDVQLTHLHFMIEKMA